jgi:hypothetical protein
MKLNKKKLDVVLPQIKAHLNVAVMMDNPESPGLVDFIFQPKAKDISPGYLNRLTCSMTGENDLFGNGGAEILGKPLMVNTALLRGALKSGNSEPEIKDGVVNGISVLAGSGDTKVSDMLGVIESGWNGIKDLKLPESAEFVMPRVDYELMANTVIPFVSHDYVRYYMSGYYVDFGKSGDFINFAATNGMRLSLCKFPCDHPKMGDDKGGGGFILNPLNLFIPESEYSRAQWAVNEYASLIRIQTEDYSIDCWAKPIEGQFPNYPKVIPDKAEYKEWINLNARSARKAFDSVRGLINDSLDGYGRFIPVFINSENPKSIKLAVSGASVDIDGEASRPMRLRMDWNHISPAFFNTPFTKFFLKDVNSAILTESLRAVPGTTMTITKVIMPLRQENGDVDAWGIGK